MFHTLESVIQINFVFFSQVRYMHTIMFIARLILIVVTIVCVFEKRLSFGQLTSDEKQILKEVLDTIAHLRDSHQESDNNEEASEDVSGDADDHVDDSSVDEEGLSKERQKAADIVEKEGDEAETRAVNHTTDHSDSDIVIQGLQYMAQTNDVTLTPKLIHIGIQLYEKMKVKDMEVVANTILQYLRSDGASIPRQRGIIPEKRAFWMPWMIHVWEKDIIPYTFMVPSGSGFQQTNGEEQTAALQAMAHIEQHTCIEFVPWSLSNKERFGLSYNFHLVFVHDEETANGACYSYVGPYPQPNMDGGQNIYACATVSLALHEISHAVGLMHEQQRFDRDRFLSFPSSIANKNPSEYTDNFKVPFDYGSTMQYSFEDFKKMYNDDVMHIYDPELRFLVGRDTGGLSHYDLMGLVRAYNCYEKHCSDTGQVLDCKNDGFPNFVGGMCRCVCPPDLKGPQCDQVETDDDCGGVVELSSERLETTITTAGYPENYGKNKRCVWLIKSPENTFTQLRFEFMKIQASSDSCVDSLEIRHNLVGQPGARLCGRTPQYSVTSYFNGMMLIFRSDGYKEFPGVKAIASYLTSDDFCYRDIMEGSDYRGTRNYTMFYNQCKPWKNARNCNVNPYRVKYLTVGLSNNYCRNPNGASQPWCYIDVDNCIPRLCDVCSINKCHDRRKDCDKRILNDPHYCQRDGGFELCHKTCNFCAK